MSALIGALRVSLSADTANFEAGMKRAQRQTQTSATAIQKSTALISRSIKGLAAGLSIGLFTRAISNALEYAGSLAETAQQLGVTAKQLQVFRYAAGQVGVSEEQLAVGLKKLNTTLGQAKLGAEGPKKAFEALSKLIGTDIVAASKQGGDALPLVADALAKVGDRSKRAAAEVALMGKSGSALDNMLSGGSGALNELSEAAEKLGIVLSDEQIRKADETADKLRALKTVLSANIASSVADNADSILTLANALATLVRSIGDAVKGWRIMMHELKAAGNFASLNFAGATRELNAAEAIRQGGIAYGVGSVTMKLPPAKPKPIAAGGGGDVGKFLASGGSKKQREDHSAEDALRDSYEFDQELRRAQMDVLRATQDLSKDYIERTSVGVQILNAEKEAYEAELQYQTKLYDLTKGKEGLSQAQADQLRAQNGIKDSLERQKLLQEEQEQRQRDVQDLTQHDFDRQREILESQANIAETAEERRKVELQILKLLYDQKRQALQDIIDHSKNIKEQEDARRDLANLDKTYANDKKGVEQGTRGPLESYLAELPTTAEKWNEALQQVAVDGLKSIEDGLLDILDGTKSVAQAFTDMARSIIRDLLKIAIRRFITAPLARALFGGFSEGGFVGDGYATGGFVSGPGSATSDSIPAFLSNGEFVINAKATRRFLPLLETLNGGDVAAFARGGISIPRHSSPHMAFAGGASFGGGVNINFHVSGNVSRETMNQIAARTKGAIATASRAGLG